MRDGAAIGVRFCDLGLARVATRSLRLAFAVGGLGLLRHHDSAGVLGKFLGGTHSIAAFRCCPSEFGFPLTRRRMLTLCVARRCLHELSFKVLPPQSFFGSQCIAPASIFYDASPEELAAAWALVVGRRGNALRKFDWHEALSAGERWRIHAQRAAARERREEREEGDDSDGENIELIDVTQNPPFGRVCRLVPCLTSRSKVWCGHLGRHMLGAEALRMMFGGPAPFDVDAVGFTPQQLRDVTGNGIHVPTATATIMTLLITGFGADRLRDRHGICEAAASGAGGEQ